jgi:hypothetical protein
MKRETKPLSAAEALAIAYGPNPLLDRLPEEILLKDLPGRLMQSPLDSVPWRDVPLTQRYPLVPLLKNHFVATPTAVEIALSIQRTIRMGYLARNPLNRQQRRKIYKINEFRELDVKTIPWFPTYASGTVIVGITGLGKSTIAQRILELFPQVIEHGANPEAGWLEMKQIVHLTVPLGGDPSRSGFLLNILAQVDEALGNSDYHARYSKGSYTVEKLMVIVAIVLSNHRCGILVIEEIQKKNFPPGEPRALMLLFFLRLLNIGIPILLIGNPVGFYGFSEFTQDVRRLYSDGYFEMWPADSIDDQEFFEHFIKGKMEFNLIDSQLIIDEKIKGVILSCTGGVHDYFCTIYSIMHDNAIRSGQTAFTISNIKEVYASSHMKPHRKIIEALNSRDPLRLLDFEDIPAAEFSLRWGIDFKAACAAAAAASNLERAATQHAARRRRTRPNSVEVESAYRSEPQPTPRSRRSNHSGSKEIGASELNSALKKEADALKDLLKGAKI